MRRRTKGGLAGLAVFSVLAVMSELGGDAGDDASVAATPVNAAETAEPSRSPTRTAIPADPTQSAGPTQPAEPTPAEPDEPTSAPAMSQNEARGGWMVIDVVDGDTIDVARGGTVETVRLVGIDTPEQGECGYGEATAALQNLIAGVDVQLTPPGTDDRDAYGRLLRYVDMGAIDAGYEQIAAGMATARYDSRDGYGRHPREDEYIAADEATGRGYACDEPESAPAPEAVDSAEPWNQPGPDLDCADIGRRVRITGEDYHRLDADGDGWGCD